MLERLINWLENHQLPCFYKKHFGIECPGCGMQTAFIELLKGNLIESIKTYPALIPIILLIIMLILHLIFRFKRGATYIKFLFIFTTLLIVLNYLYKLINT